MRRPDASVGSSLWTLGVIVGVGLLLSVLTFVPAGTRGAVTAGAGESPGDVLAGDGGSQAAVDPATADVQGASGGGAPRKAGTSSGGGAQGGAVGAADTERCTAQKNGGSTDVGVTGGSIKLAATVVDDGPGSSFLAPVRIGMNAVLNKVNRAGGVCGRKLQLILRNDSWDASLGATFIKNFVESEKVFALAVVPSSEGLNSADAYIQQKQVPVVGTDGMLIKQYLNPWIWPVATSTISTMHIMAKNAHDRGATHFGIVFDAKYHFGVEGAFAFNQAVARLTGNGIAGFDESLKKCEQRFCGIQPGQSAYTSQARSFNTDCYGKAPQCQFVAFLLEPDTARVFMNEPRNQDPTVGMGGAQPLFNRNFAEACGAVCHKLWVWTGYKPAIEAIATEPAVAAFVNDVRAESASADVNNQFLEGGYVGMRLLVEALTKVGPNLTRQNLKNVLDNMTFDSGLSQPLTWRAGNHFANKSARPFEIQFQAKFNGWRAAGDFITDPWVGQDAPKS